jgi:hypothetical protein
VAAKSAERKWIMNAEKSGSRPLAFGYMSLHTQEVDEGLGELEAVMRERAEQDGYRFVTTFHEYPNGSFAGFYELMRALEKTGARHVIAPTLEHISSHSVILNHLLERLTEKDTEVHTLNGD